MNCPFCAFEGTPRGLHAHLADEHPDAVRFEEKLSRTFYAIDCPVCGEGYQHQIKPRGRDPGFVDEFSAQIRLVAFDMLVNHLLAEHVDTPASAPPEAEAPPPAAPGAGPAWLQEARQKRPESGSPS